MSTFKIADVVFGEISKPFESQNLHAHPKGVVMKIKVIALSLFAFLALTSEIAAAKGCLKGAAVGGVAGHVAGHHGLIGAAGGCVIGRHRANKQAKEAQTQQQGDQRNSAATQSDK